MQTTGEKTDSKSRFPNLRLSKRLFLTAIVASLVLIAIAPVLQMLLWYCILLGGTAWQKYLSPGTLPEYDGVYLRLSDNKVESLSFGFHSPIPQNYFLIVDGLPKALIDIRPDDLTSLGMTSDPNPTFGDLSFELGTIRFLSFGEFKNVCTVDKTFSIQILQDR
jgi:hypothetical protein